MIDYMYVVYTVLYLTFGLGLYALGIREYEREKVTMTGVWCIVLFWCVCLPIAAVYKLFTNKHVGLTE